MMEGEQPAAVSCTYSRGQKWYNDKAAEVRSRAQQAFVKITKDKMEDNVKGIKVTSCALNMKPSKPLMHAKRDRVGPAGQKIGTITMDPCEVDGIATRAWKAIYNGNCSDLKQSVSYFKDKYSKYLFYAPEYKLKPIVGRELMETCTHGKKSSPGLDNWEPAELALLSPTAFDWLATMLNLVEAGSPWPDGMQHSKAAYLAKGLEKCDDPLSYRVLMVLPAVNRAWATHRLHDMEPWTEKWALSRMYAGVGTQGAEDAWYAFATQKGHLDLMGTPYVGGTIDISKCFDQVNRQLVKQLATDAGMDLGVLNAYLRYQDELQVHNSIAGGIGKGFTRRTGIPQGCPLSMNIITLLLIRTWLLEKLMHESFLL